MSNYTDQIEKINYYKRTIIESLTKSGVFPNNIIVNNKIKDIDTALAIFQYINNRESEAFNTDKFNEDFKRIYDDLIILYKVAYQVCIKQFEEIKSYAETHLLELEELARAYEYKTKFEIDSTSLGKTIFFQANGFNIKQENGIARIYLGDIMVHNASKIACIFNADGVKDEQVVFTLNGNNCSPYSYNKDFFKVDGTLNIKTYNYNLPQDIQTNNLFEMLPDEFKLNYKAKYIIYGGKDMISTKLGISRRFYQKTMYNPIIVSGTGRIEFYIIDASFVSFDFSQQPLNTNFSGTKLDIVSKHQKIVIEYANTFSFDFSTDGMVYATKESGIIENDKLYYPNNDALESFFIEEYDDTNTTVYNNVVVTISDLLSKEPLKINTIAIKELSALDELE